MLSTNRRKICSTAATATTTEEEAAAAAADAVAGNIDLLEAILLRLPLKSLVRSKAVSKHWLSVITSPDFSCRRNPNPNLPLGLFLHRSEHLFRSGDKPSSFIPKVCYVPINDNENQASDPFFTPLAFFNDNPDVYILQSCNGLLCCCDSTLQNLYIVNPTTKQFRGPIQRPSALKCFGVCIAFEPSKSPHYKVICVRDTEFSTCWVKYYQVEVYSSETSTWRLSGDPFSAYYSNCIQFSRGVFWNGAINWFGPNGESLYFNLDREKLQTMPLPPMHYWKVRYFRESRDHLHLVEYNNSSGIGEFKIYEMERDYSCWFMKYSVDLDKIGNAFPEMIKHYCPEKKYLFSILCIVRRENDDELIVVLHTPNKVILYNLKDKTSKKIFDFESSGTEDPDCDRSIKFGWFNAYPYTESLSSV